MKRYFGAIALLMMFLPGTMVLTSCGGDENEVPDETIMLSGDFCNLFNFIGQQ